MDYIGVQRLLQIDGGLSQQHSYARPPVNTEWLPISIHGYHDDSGGAKTSYFTVVTPEGDLITKSASISAGFNNAISPFVAGFFNSGIPLILTHDFYLRFTVSSIGAGKLSKIAMILLERRENEDAKRLGQELYLSPTGSPRVS
jgi:hypothetical protein